MAIPFNYIARNMVARRLTTALTAGGMALVVYVFATVLMLAAGLEKTLVATGQDETSSSSGAPLFGLGRISSTSHGRDDRHAIDRRAGPAAVCARRRPRAPSYRVLARKYRPRDFET